MAAIYSTYGRDQMLKSTYGITLIDYKVMLESQNNSCKICKIHQDELKRHLNVDHDHKTGIVRGLLCCKCNRGLGHFNDSKELMLLAIEYLNKHKKDEAT